MPLAIASLLVLRACLHDAPLDRLSPAAAIPGDPPGTTAHAGSLYIARGGPVIVGFQSAGRSRLAIAGHELIGGGLRKDRIVLPEGPIAIRFAAAPGARLVWSPVGRRGDPEYVPASSLSPEPPATATFSHPGTAPLDGAIALAILAIVIGALLYLARHRLARVTRDGWLAIGGVFALALLARALGLGDAGQTWDEDVNWAAGRNYVTNLVSLDFSDAAWSWNYEHPPVMKYLAGIGAQFADGFGPARFLSALVGALGCALLVPIGARLFRLRVGVLAGVLAALTPALVAHGQVVGHESPTVLWWSLGILLALTAHDDVRTTRTLIIRLAWIGVAIGIATASRFVNGLLGPLCALIVLVSAPPGWRLRTLAWGALVMPLVAVVTVYAVWPRLWLHPIDHLTAAFAKLDVLHAPEPFVGGITQTPDARYFALYLLATAPLGLLAGVVLWLLRAAFAGFRALAAYQPALIRTHALLFAWFAIPLLGLMLSPVRQDGVRYVMPCVLAFAMLAAVGVDALAKTIASRHAFPVAAGLLGIYLAITLLRTRPYYLDYFSEWTGGAGEVAAEKRYEVAWWGEGLDRAVAYVNANAAPGDAVHRDCVEPAHLVWLREDLWAHLVRSPAQASWIIVYAPATKPCALPADAREAYVVRHDGAVLAAVFYRPSRRP